MTAFDSADFRFFFGVAGGSAKKALRHLEEPDIMLSYATANNTPVDCENLFIDSGGYSLMIEKGEHEPPAEYLDYLETADPEYFALQDYPCEPEIMDEYDRSVQQHQELTREYHAEGLAKARDRGLDGEPIAVLQGWERDDYIRCIERFEDAGLLTDYLGIGSVCRRNAGDEITQIVTAIREQLPNRKLHAFGVKTSVLKNRRALNALDSADSLAYDYSYEQTVPGPRWHQVAHNYLSFKERIGAEVDAGDAAVSDAQTQITAKSNWTQQ
jgi:hypothetical protein